MRADLGPIDDRLDQSGTEGYLLEASSDEADQAYLSGFWAPDPFVTLYTDGSVHCLVKPLEYGRARATSLADSVSNVVEYDFFDRLEVAERHEAWGMAIADFCETHGVDRVSVPGRFPLAIAEVLTGAGMTVVTDTNGVIGEVRAVKTEEELEAIAEAQAAAEAAMGAAEAAIADSAVEDDGRLVLDGEVLTSETVKTEIERTLLEHRCALDETIVACGADAADPHDRGSGPLRANETIIIDIFPRHKETSYFGDLTRTFVKGDAAEAHERWYELTLEAQTAAFETLEAGTSGEAVHDAVCDVYEANSFATLRSDPEAEIGFIHSTGHGVGLAIHEGPSLGQTGEELVANHVVTVEPGLYDPTVGGVRIEDLVVITEDGYHNLTEYPKDLVVE